MKQDSGVDTYFPLAKGFEGVLLWILCNQGQFVWCDAPLWCDLSGGGFRLLVGLQTMQMFA